MIHNKKLRTLLLALLATVTCGAAVACADDGGNTSTPSSTTSESTADTFTVKFVNEDGTVLQSSDLEAGEMPEYTGEAPTKAATAEYTYTFSGWDKEIGAVTASVTYTAQYTSVKNKYTVTFKNADGTVLQTVENVEYGTVAAYPTDAAAPTKAEDATGTYTFNGWNNALAAVTGNVEYVATYTTTYKEYSITFKKDGDVLAEKTDYHYGDAITPPNAEKTDDAQYDYEFLGWKLEGTEDTAIVTVDGTVAASKVYVAVYSTTVKKYDVTFKNGDAIVYKDKQVPYGEVPVYEGEALVKNGLGVWTFGWDRELTAVDGENLVYNAVFTPVLTYKITANEGSVTAVYAGQDQSLPNVALADLSQATSYDFVVEGLDYTEHENVTITLGVNYNGMTIAAANGTVIPSYAREMLEITVLKDGTVYSNGELIAGAAMAEGVLSFTITRDPATHLYAQAMCGGVVYDGEFAPKAFVNAKDQLLTTGGNGTVADVTSTVEAPLGATKVYSLTASGFTFAKLNSVLLDDYVALKFYIQKGTDGTLFHSSSGNWDDRKYELTAGQWARVTLTRNEQGTFDVAIAGAKEINAYAPIADLNEFAVNASNGVCYISNLMGIKIQKNYVTVTESMVTNASLTIEDESATHTLADGFAKAIKITNGTYAQFTMNAADLSVYEEVRFGIKATSGSAGYTLFFGGTSVALDTNYNCNTNTDWLIVRLVKNGEGWDIYYGTQLMQTAFVLPNNNLSDVKANFGVSSYYMTEMLGVEKA